jgi:hypothetical protein
MGQGVRFVTRPIPQLREALARCRELERAIDEALTAAEQGLTDAELERDEDAERPWDEDGKRCGDPPGEERCHDRGQGSADSCEGCPHLEVLR